MILTRAPLRISLAGGGTDLPGACAVTPGQVVSVAIDRYIWINVNPKFGGGIRLAYSQTENVAHADELRHDMVREALHQLSIREGVEISSIADVPAAGTGLGSSGSFLVAVLLALYAYLGMNPRPDELAEMACHIELNVLNRPCGRQDQWIAALGGLQRLTFQPSGTVHHSPLLVSSRTLAALESQLIMVYTSRQRDSSVILAEQARRTLDNGLALAALRRQATQMVDLLRAGPGAVTDGLGELLAQGWQAKCSLAEGITCSEVDGLMARALAAGATGGKLLGAGGGGFLALHCPSPEVRAAVSRAVAPHLVIQWHMAGGASIVYKAS